MIRRLKLLAIGFLPVLLVIGGLFFLMETSESEDPAGQAQTTEVEETTSSVEESQLPTQQPTVTEKPSQEAAESGEENNACLDCHTDQQALIDTAKPEEDVGEESSGAG